MQKCKNDVVDDERRSPECWVEQVSDQQSSTQLRVMTCGLCVRYLNDWTSHLSSAQVDVHRSQATPYKPVVPIEAD